MPHFVIEYSANLDEALDIRDVIRVLHAAVIETGAFPAAALRTRSARREDYLIGDGDPANAFLAITGRIAAGRSDALRQSLGQRIFAAVRDHVVSVVGSAPLSLTLELQEIDPSASFRHLPESAASTPDSANS